MVYFCSTFKSSTGAIAVPGLYTKQAADALVCSQSTPGLGMGGEGATEG